MVAHYFGPRAVLRVRAGQRIIFARYSSVSDFPPLSVTNRSTANASGDPAPLSFEDTAVAFASKSDGELRRMYALFATMNNNVAVKMGGSLVKTAFKLHLPVKFIVKNTVFKQFCGGETIAECRPVIDELARFNIGTILDYSVEGEGSERSFERTADEIVATVEAAARAGRDRIPFAVFKVTGVGDVDLLARAQSGKPLTQDQKGALERAEARVDRICKRAHDLQVRVFIDAEESWIQQTIDQLAVEMMRRYNRDEALIYNTYQFYRHDRLTALRADYEQAKVGDYYVGAKLVRGAYLEKEARRAQRLGYANPMNATKPATDQLYDDSLRFSLAHLDRLAICVGTHNEDSSRLATELMRQYNVAPGDERVYFAQLYGMSDNLSYNLANAGYRVAKYVPYGPVEAVMPYLLRRADENTAIAGQSSREFLLIKKEMDRRRQQPASR